MYEKRQKGWKKHIDFIMLDKICIVFSIGVGYAARHGANIGNSNIVIYNRLLLMYLIVDLLVGFINDSYKNIVRRGYLKELKETVFHCLIVDMFVMVMLFLMQETSVYSRTTMIVFWQVQILSMYGTRCIRKHQLRVKMVNNPYTEQMLILTDSKHVTSCVSELALDKYRNYCIIGTVIVDDEQYHDEYVSASAEWNVPVVCKYDDLDEYILNNVVDSVFIDAELEENECMDLINRLVESCVTVHFNLLKLRHNLSDKAVERIGKFTVFTVGMRIATRRQIFLKRIVDIAGGLVGVFFMLIFGIFLAPVIYIQSPGPIFFSQERVGKNGRVFKMYKFRSMYVDAEKRKEELMQYNKMEGFMFKMDDDPRITPIGKFMRKYSIDEFPQFINVLKGDMSLVGTRPPTLDEYEQYQLHHRGRLNSKPGITGLWQVSGRNDITDFEKVIELDTQYIANWSLSGDIKILWQTVRNVVRGSGAG